MNSKLKVTPLLLAIILMASCSSFSQTPDGFASRNPSQASPDGTGQVDSSEGHSVVTSSYKLPIVRDDNQKIKALAYNYWSGEYPKPAIDVNTDQDGTTKINGYKSLRNLTEPIECELKNGVYHPWSDSDGSVINYYTITERSDYKVIKTFRTEQKEVIVKGAELSNVHYQGENWCGAVLKRKKIIKQLSLSCEYFNDSKLVSEIETKNNFKKTEQWLYVKCENKDDKGNNIKAFVQDTYLAKQTQLGIKEACITGYGTVGPHKSEDCF